MKYFITYSLVAVGIVHFLPILGAFGSDALQRLYGIDTSEPNTLLLLRHRAILFGLLGIVMVYSGVTLNHVGAVLLLGVITTLSFIILAHGQSPLTAEIKRVLLIDWACLSLLISAAGLTIFQSPN